MEKAKNLSAGPMDVSKGAAIARGCQGRGLGGVGPRGKNWDNCNSIINKK